jgi:hypothetical protein
MIALIVKHSICKDRTLRLIVGIYTYWDNPRARFTSEIRYATNVSASRPYDLLAMLSLGIIGIWILVVIVFDVKS